MKEIKTLLLVLLAAVYFMGMYVICDIYATDAVEEFSGRIKPSLINKGEGGQLSPYSSIEELSVENLVQTMVKGGYSSDISLLFGGDILCQSSQLDLAYDSTKEGYDFAECFADIASYVKNADYSVLSLKTTFAGAYNGVATEYRGYGTDGGQSNCPESMAVNIADAGFDLVNLATNHAMDSGTAGIASTIDFLDQARLAHVGTASEQDGIKSYTELISGIKVGFIGYTTSTKVQVPSDESYMLNLADPSNESQVKALCARVSELNSDCEFVVVLLNFGDVNSTEIEPEQKKLAQSIADAGASVIVGTGSRAMKPAQKLYSRDFEGNDHETLVFYGLGSILSSEHYQSDDALDVDLSALIRLNVSRIGVADPVIAGFEVMPIYADWTDEALISRPIAKIKNTSDYEGQMSSNDLERVDYGYRAVIEKLTSEEGFAYTESENGFMVTIQ